MTGSHLVDYDAAAHRYRDGRALPADVLARWGEAVRPHLPPGEGGRLRVLDLGAGTGIFAAVWPGWGASHVVAVEASAGMIAERQDTAPYVQGAAEALPLAAGSVDVAWLSATFHHYRDQAAAVAELDRVLVAGGRVLIRTMLPGRSGAGWLAAFPAQERMAARVLDLDRYAELFRPAGFRVVGVEDVPELTVAAAAAADWAERMHHADSLLTVLTDDELADGLAVLRRDPEAVVTTAVSLVVLERGV